MALKNVKANASGGKHKARYVTRAEAKAGARQARRAEDAALSGRQLDCARAGYCVRTLGSSCCSLCGRAV